jgi:DNA phosphorothioation-associated putative methyltransferase
VNDQATVKIKRHRTAIKRASFSLPIKCLLRDGLLSRTQTLFDYGCGHGRDLELLSDIEIDCGGWDPSFCPDAEISRADIVNLGYVLNVIEDVPERVETLLKAWDLCDCVLTVAAQIEFAAPDREQESFADGVLTSRQTFQKYYNQNELREFLESTLREDAISAAPGVFYIFKDEEAKQQFIANRYHRRISVPRRRISEVLFEQNQDVLEPFMNCLTRYGRIPAAEELEQSNEIVERFGSLKRAFKLVQKVTNESPWEEIAQKRTEDLLVYLALAHFRKRPPSSRLPGTIQHDVKAFLGGYKIACGRADALLFRAGDPGAIDQACRRASVGQLVDNALILHRSSLDYLEPLLRIYEGCARALVGEIDEANIIKLHRFSGKVSYISYPDFEKKAHPALRQRIKVSLPTLSIEFYDYSNWEDPPILFRKDELVHRDHPKSKLFKTLSRQEAKYGLLPDPDGRCTLTMWQNMLNDAGLMMRGHRLSKSPGATSR